MSSSSSTPSPRQRAHSAADSDDYLEPLPSGIIAKLQSVPKSDIPLKPAGSFRRSSSSRFREEEHERLKKLPGFEDVPVSEHKRILIEKIDQCKICFDFLIEDESLERVRDMEIKRETLLELVEYAMTTTGGITPDIYPNIVQMVSKNLFRPLPPRVNPASVEYDPEEDEPILEAAWQHIQIVYEFFLRFIEMPDFSTQHAKKYINQELVTRLFELFDSEDPRERDYLKTTLHRIYGKFLNLRAYIRKTTMNVFCTVVHENKVHNGIAELLEILGSIINGFSIPLKEEHRFFLIHALLPLHKARYISMFHPQLSYCVCQYLEKSPDLSDIVVDLLLRWWPQSNSGKEVLFIGELEEVIYLMEPEQFTRVQTPIFKRIAKCIGSEHFQVAERALSIWNNDYIVQLIGDGRQVILPIIFPALFRVSKHHWNKTIRGLACQTMKLFMDLDLKLFSSCTLEYKEGLKHNKKAQKRQDELWSALEKAVAEGRTVDDVTALNGGASAGDGTAVGRTSSTRCDKDGGRSKDRHKEGRSKDRDKDKESERSEQSQSHSHSQSHKGTPRKRNKDKDKDKDRSKSERDRDRRKRDDDRKTSSHKEKHSSGDKDASGGGGGGGDKEKSRKKEKEKEKVDQSDSAKESKERREKRRGKEKKNVES